MITKGRSPTETPRSAGRGVVAVPVMQFAAIGLAAVVIVGVATATASGRVGQREAITDARNTTLIKAQGLVEPAVTDGLATGDPAAVAAVATVVGRNVINTSLVRVKIWNATGRILYSNARQLEGTTHALGADEIRTLRAGLIEADVSDLSKPENRYERTFPQAARGLSADSDPERGAASLRGVLPL